MPPPADYYTSHLERLFDWVATHQASLLDPRSRGFLARYAQLTGPARRLLARLLMRARGPRRLDSCLYPEVPDAGAAALELCLAGAARWLGDRELDRRLLLCRRAELLALLSAAGMSVTAAARRDDLLMAAAGALDRAGPAPALLALPRALELCCDDAMATLRLLFFGNPRQDLVDFVLEDIGQLRFEPYPVQPRGLFRDAADVQRSLQVHALADCVRDGVAALPAAARPLLSPRLLRGLTLRLLGPVRDDDGHRRRGRALVRLGRAWEAVERPSRAVLCYLRADDPAGRERAVRLLAACGRTDSARRLLQDMTRMPASAAEQAFAGRFDPRRGRCRPRSTPRALFRQWRLPRRVAGGGVEAAVAAELMRHGLAAAHLENGLPRALFGLLFWDLIFAPVPGAFVQPFQLGPRDLFSPAFRRRRRPGIERRLQALRVPGAARARLLDTWHARRGVANALVPWRQLSLPLLLALLDAMPGRAVAALCDVFAEDPQQWRRGFPDLCVIGAGTDGYAFLEVKGPGDRLRDEQLAWLDACRRHDIAAGVVEVAWR